MKGDVSMKKLLSLLLVAVMALGLFGTAFAEDLGDSLILYSTMTQKDLDVMLDGFAEAYPDITVEVVSGTIGETMARIKAEAADPQGDLVWGGLCDSDGMAYSDLFEHWASDYAADAIDGYACDNGFYSMDHLSTVVFCVNTELEAELGLNIQGYEDLLTDALKGKILLANPNSSSSSWNNLCNIMAVYGPDSDAAWDYITKLMPNLVITDSSSACFKQVQAGEYPVGLTYEDGVSKLIQSGATNIRMVYPADGASASAFGAAVIKGAKHEAAAKAMVNWICSAEGSTYIAAGLQTLRMTNKNTVYGAESYLPATEDIKWVFRDVAYLTENKPQILEHWNSIYTSVQN